MDGQLAAALLISLSAPCVGSFIGLAAERLACGRSVVSGRSGCTCCGAALRWYELIPIFSWLSQAGRCRRCDSVIGWIPLISEIAALAIAIWVMFALPKDAWLPGLALGWSLLLLSLIDLKSMLLPDRITLPLLVGGLIAAAVLTPARLSEHALGAAIGFLSLTALALLYERARGSVGLGGGDAKLFAAIGAWVGWMGLPSALLIAGIVGIGHAIVRGGGRLTGADRIPFGPALALGGWIVWLHGPLVWS
ncbi:MAG TPA: A24 family peptidase [Alphaproteobacteria bacterium]|nr:A24 family peptidase [Alphaproteobacteria bacterium]